VIVPDYPGFGNSDMPDPTAFAYIFEKFSEVTEKFLKQKGFDHFGLFMQDYGGRIEWSEVTLRHPTVAPDKLGFASGKLWH
jgi:pimeloyl-ACP methyl ester carboxylesterase